MDQEGIATMSRKKLPPGELTPYQARVIPYIVKGLTIRETAEILHLSRPTVVSRLQQVYIRLGINSRAELAIEAAARGLIAAPAPDDNRIRSLLKRAGHDTGSEITWDVLRKYSALLIAGALA